MRRLAAILGFCLLTSPAFADGTTASALKELAAAVKKGTTDAPAARAAWDKLVARGAETLPEILEAMDTSDTVLANWLRTAYDRIVTSDPKGINADTLLAFAKDAKRQGRARRLALETVDNLRPGTSAKLIPGWLDDPEFRYDAVAVLLKDADDLANKGDTEKAIAAYKKCFAAAQDVPQAQALASRLKDNGVQVSVAEHLGFFTDWYVIGPFDAKMSKGFKTVYPPEEKVDLNAELEGKDGKVKWKRYQVKEALSGLPARVALVNLLEPLGNHEDCVGYGYTTFTVPAATEVEFRGAADDNFQVRVNGKREFGFEEYRNGVRLDRHRFKVKLVPGANTVLVKVCQAPLDSTNPEPNWEFLLRMVDGKGDGVRFKSTLPEVK